MELAPLTPEDRRQVGTLPLFLAVVLLALVAGGNLHAQRSDDGRSVSTPPVTLPETLPVPVELCSARIGPGQNSDPCVVGRR